jgi:hypothetical protein
MNDRPRRLSPRRFRYAWKLMKAFSAEQKGQFDRALELVDDAAEIMPLYADDRVRRALLLLKAQRTRDAHAAFAALRNEFKGSDDPDIQYLRHYCTHQLSLLTPSSGQWGYEAKQAKLINCRRYLKHRYRMVTVDEIYEGIKPRH